MAIVLLGTVRSRMVVDTEHSALGVAVSPMLALAPGLSKTTLSFSVPDIKSGKLALDYSRASLSAKASMGLTATPKAECSVSTTMRDLTVGGEVGYDSKASAVSKWSVGAQYKLPSLVLA